MKSCKKCGEIFEPRKGFINYCSTQCRNFREQTEEIRLKKSEAAKNSEKVYFANKQQRVTKKKLPRKIISCLKCGEPLEVLAHLNRKYHADCWKKASGGYRENSTKKHRCFYKEFQMDSGAEKLFAILLDELSIRWEKNKKTYFSYVRADGRKGKYYPDFYLPDYNKWVEIKGKFYADRDENLELKLKAVPGISIVYSTELTKEKVKQILAY